MQKLLSVAIPCFNSEDYVEKAIKSLLPGEGQVEIIVVDDGSTDGTAEIASEYKNKYPDTVRVITKENGGHGDAVMAATKAAGGLYFRVLDSDDWLDGAALTQLLKILEEMRDPEKAADLVISNYVYEKVSEGRSHPINYRKTIPSGRLFGWDEVGKWSLGSYILMHAATYRTEIVHKSEMQLPKHTFYVDHLYVCRLMMHVKKMYYLDADLYHYFIGRADQSVNEKVMLSRIDQQLRVNRLMLYELDADSVEDRGKREYLYYYTEIVTLATVSFLLRRNTKEDEKVMEDFLDEIEEKRPVYYAWIMGRPFYRHMMGPIRRLPHWFGYPLYRICYIIARRIFGFN
ncbi:MAG: glycosyltransferase family 2 protein [Lachnospiraceae bacterium]|nr:glycosyltransferase family 2 protein [Lachnospiraceae bacterium]